MSDSCDVIIIGAGIAGASLASTLCQDRTHPRKIILLEQEDHPGYHATGRSAAIFLPTYGPPPILALTRASADFFHNPPQGFCQTPLLSPRATMMIAKSGDETHIQQALGAGMREILISQAQRRLSPLNTDIYERALVDDETCDIDVDVLLQAHLKNFRQKDGTLHCRCRVENIARQTDRWQVSGGGRTFTAPIVVNAAGAWADDIATMAGVTRCGLQPKRRSAALIDVSDKWDITNWPLTVGAGDTFYFRPIGTKLMISPADQTPLDPHDAWADDMAIAQAMELFMEATGYEVTHVEHTWAGLRTFVEDGNPIIGFEPSADGFFWLAGQGGYGIQTSPAISQLATALIQGKKIPAAINSEFEKLAVEMNTISPDRF